MKRREQIAFAVLSHRKELGNIKSPRTAWKRFEERAAREELEAVPVVCKSKGFDGQPFNLRAFDEGWKGLGILFDEVRDEAHLVLSREGYLVRYAKSVKVLIRYFKNGKWYWLSEFQRTYKKNLLGTVSHMSLEKREPWGVSETSKHDEDYVVTVVYAIFEELGIWLTEKQIDEMLFEVNPGKTPDMRVSRIYAGALNATEVQQVIITFDTLPEELQRDEILIHDTNVEIRANWVESDEMPPGVWKKKDPSEPIVRRCEGGQKKLFKHEEDIQRAVNDLPAIGPAFINLLLGPPEPRDEVPLPKSFFAEFES
jgi:hypothetical protein